MGNCTLLGDALALQMLLVRRPDRGNGAVQMLLLSTAAKQSWSHAPTGYAVHCADPLRLVQGALMGVAGS
jgi:hypothetical protein